MKKLSILVSALSLLISFNVKAADPLSMLGALDNLVRAVSVADIISKAVANGANIKQVKTVPKLKVVDD
jgi:DNA-binding protein